MAVQIRDLMSALVVIVVGLVLFPVVVSQVNATNVTGVTGGSLVGLIPMLYLLIIFGGAIGYVVIASKQ